MCVCVGECVCLRALGFFYAITKSTAVLHSTHCLSTRVNDEDLGRLICSCGTTSQQQEASSGQEVSELASDI